MSEQDMLKLLDAITLHQTGWESSEDIMTFNGTPIGMTVSGQHSLEINRWWPGLKRAIAKFVSESLPDYAALEQQLAEAREHERQTHERLGAILGTDDSLEELAKKLKAENNRLFNLLVATGFVGRGTTVIGDKRYEQLRRAEQENERLKRHIRALVLKFGNMMRYDKEAESIIVGASQALAEEGQVQPAETIGPQPAGREK